MSVAFILALDIQCYVWLYQGFPTSTLLTFVVVAVLCSIEYLAASLTSTL